MKSWLNWLAECGLEFTRIDDGTADAREYMFGENIKVIKREKGKGSRGGVVIANGFTTFHGSVKDLTNRILEVVNEGQR